MFKKMMKSLYTLSLMLLSVGALIFTFGAVKTGQVQGASPDAYVSQSGKENIDQSWTEYVTASSVTTLTKQGEYFLVTNADELAFVSYQVLQGAMIEEEEAATASYFINKDINLDGKLWTPIGDSQHPFKGRIISDNKTISNIICSENADSSAGKMTGFIGYAEGAYIEGINIDSFTLVSTPTNDTGVFLANGKDTIIVNCYDNRTASGDGILSIGTLTGNSALLNGGHDGNTYYTDSDTIDSLMTVQHGDTTVKYGYAVSFAAREGATYVYDPSNGSSKVNYFVAIGKDGQKLDLTLNSQVKDHILSSTNSPDLRVNAVKKQEKTAYYMHEGYKLSNWSGANSTGVTIAPGADVTTTSIDNLLSASLKFLPTESASAVSVTFDYDYGEDDNARKSVQEVPYDGSLKDYIDKHDELKTRIGYTFKDAKVGETLVAGENAQTYLIGDTISGQDTSTDFTVTLEWTAQKIGAFTMFAAAANNSFIAGTAIVSATVSDGTEDGAQFPQDKDSSLTSENGAQVENCTAGTPVTLTLGLQEGYTLKNFTIGKSGEEEWQVYAYTDGTFDKAGVSISANYTNKDTGYKATEGLSDPYTPVGATINKQEGSNTFTIQLNNIVSSSVKVYIVIERTQYEISLEGTGISGEGEGSVVLAEENKSKYTALSEDGKTLFTRINEQSKVTITADSGYYFSATDGNGTISVNASGVEGHSVTGSIRDGDQAELGTTYHFYGIAVLQFSEHGFQPTNQNIENGRKIDFGASQLLINLKIEITNSTPIKNYENPKIHINGDSSSVGVTDSQLVNLQLMNVEGLEGIQSGSIFGFQFKLDDTTANAYSLQTSTLTKGGEGDSQSLKIGTNGADNYAYGTFTLGETYTLTLTVEPIKYTINYEIYIDDTKIESETLNKYFQPITGITEQKTATEEVTLSITPTDDAQKYLRFKEYTFGTDESKVSQSLEKTNVTKEEAMSFTATVAAIGKTSTTQTFKIYFKSKEVILSFNQDTSTPAKGYTGNGGNNLTGEVDNAIIATSAAEGYDGKLKAKFNPADSSYSLTTDIDGVNIISGYYFLGWYLKAGETVYTSNQNGYAANGVLSAESVKGYIEQQDADSVTLEMFAHIAAKTITFKFDATGDTNGLVYHKKGSNGDFSDYEQGADKLVVEESKTYSAKDAMTITLDNKNFYKVAYTFRAWNNEDLGISTNGSHTLSEDNFKKIFTDETIINEQYKLYKDDGKFTHDSYTVTLTATWDAATLKFTADEGGATQTTKIGDRIILTRDANKDAETAQYSVQSGTLNSKKLSKGHRASGFTITTNNGSEKTTECKITEENSVSLEITDANIKDLIPQAQWFATNGEKADITAKTTEEANVYTITIQLTKLDGDVEYPEKMSKDGQDNITPSLAVQVTYNTDLAEQLNTIKLAITRLGYKLVSLTGDTNEPEDRATMTVKYNESTWQTCNYDYAMDMTVKPVWEVDEENYYLSAEVTAQEKSYNGDEQEVATVAYKVLTETDPTALEGVQTNLALANGDKILSFEWQKWNESAYEKATLSTTNSLTSLSLKNVNKSGKYRIKITLQDRISQTTYDIYSCTDSEEGGADVKINKNTLVVASETELQSYYTSTKEFVNAAEEEPELKLFYGTENTKDIGIQGISVELVDDTNKFAVKEDKYLTKYIFTMSEEVAANFESAMEGQETNKLYTGEGNYYVYVGSITTIVKSPVTIQISGAGFVNGQKQAVKVGDISSSVTQVAAAGITFEATGMTSSAEAGTYGQGGEKVEITFHAYKGEDKDNDLAENFDYNNESAIQGTFVIHTLDELEAKTTTFDIKYVKAQDGDLVADETTKDAFIFKITSLSYSGGGLGETQTESEIENGTFSRVDGTSPILTITGNGSEDLSIITNGTYTISFTVEVKKTGSNGESYKGGVVRFTTDSFEIEAIKTLLNTFGGSTTTSVTTENVTADATYTAVVSSAKAVKVETNDGADAQYKYLNNGDTINLAQPSTGIVGATFSEYKVDGEDAGIKVESSTQLSRTEEDTSLVAASVSAHYTVEDIKAEQSDKISQHASATHQYQLEEEKFIKADSWTNKNTDGKITYTYSWAFKKKNGEEQQYNSIDVLSIAKNTTNNGTYKLTITASVGDDAKGYIDGTKTKDLEVEIEFTLVKISSMARADELGELTYANKDYASEIQYKLTFADGTADENETDTFALTAQENGAIHFTITAKDEMTTKEVKNAGTYTIKLNFDSTIFQSDNGDITAQLEIKKYVITVENNNDIHGLEGYQYEPIEDIYGTYQGVNEQVMVYFKAECQSDSEPGSYKISFKEAHVGGVKTENYTAEVSENTWFTLKEPRQPLVISLAEGESLDNFAKDYDDIDVEKVEAKYDESVWKLQVFNTGVEEPVATIKLKVMRDMGQGHEDLQEITGDVEKALNGFPFTFQYEKVHDAGSYTIMVGEFKSINPETDSTFSAGGAHFAEGTEIKFTIKPRTLNVVSFDKEFDGTNVETKKVKKEDQSITGVQGDDEVSIKGTFEDDITVGDNKTVHLEIVAGDNNEKNYKLSSDSFSTAQITKSDAAVTLNSDSTAIYAEIAKEADVQALTPILSLSLQVEGFENVSQYISIKEVKIYDYADGDNGKPNQETAETTAYSTAQKLKVGTYWFKFTLDDKNFSDTTKYVKVTITQKEINVIPDSPISKVYDGNENVNGVEWKKDDIVEQDNVTISGTYDNKEVGESKQITITISGDDSANYKLEPSTTTGSITRAEVTIKLSTNEFEYVDKDDFNTNEELKPSAYYDQAQEIKIPYPLVEYTTDGAKTKDEVMGMLVAPTKRGYTFKAWKNDDTEVSAANIESILQTALGKQDVTLKADWAIQKQTLKFARKSVTGAQQEDNMTLTITATDKNGNSATQSEAYDSGKDCLVISVVVDYYAKVDVKVAFSNFYVFTGLEGDKSNFGTYALVKGDSKANGNFTIDKVYVADESSIDFILDKEIQVKIIVDEDVEGHQYATVASPEEWANEEGKYTKTYGYDTNNTQSLQNILPTLSITEYTYELTSWLYSNIESYNDKSVGKDEISSTILSSIVDAQHLNITIDKDFTIYFKATWKGITYTIQLDAQTNQGQVDREENITNVEYGKAISGIGERNATRVGYVFGGWYTTANGDGRHYEASTPLQDPNESRTLTLYARFNPAKHNLTFKFHDGDKAHFKRVTLSGVESAVIDLLQDTNQEKQYSIEYDKTIAKLEIAMQDGYTYKVEISGTATSEGTMNGLKNTPQEGITFKNLVVDTTVTLYAEPVEFTISVINPTDGDENSHAKIKSVQVDESEAQEQTGYTGSFTAKTGQTLKIVFTADAGYTFDTVKEQVFAREYNGVGNVAYDGKNGTLTVTWTGFTDDTHTTGNNLWVRANAKLIKVTFRDDGIVIGNSGSEKVPVTSNIDVKGSISHNSGNTTVAPLGQVEFYTGETITLSVTLKYGFETITLSMPTDKGISSQAVGEEMFSEVLYTYSKEFTIKDFTEDFAVNIQAVARKYKLAFKSSNDKEGTVQPTSVDSVDYGSTVKVKADVLQHNKQFKAWVANYGKEEQEVQLSTKSEFDFVINETIEGKDIKQILEQGTKGQTLEITGVFADALKQVTVTIGEHGSATYSAGEQEDVAIESDVPFDVYYNTTLTIKITADQYYELNKVKFDSEDDSNGYLNREEMTITIANFASTSPDTISITFIEAKIEVPVVAQVVLGSSRKTQSDKAGVIKLVEVTNEEGLQVTGEDTNNTIKGTDGNFKVASRNFQTLYFYVKGNEGYTYAGYDQGHGQYSVEETSTSSEGYSEGKIIIIKGLKEGEGVYFNFTANSNTITIELVYNGGVVPGGSIVVAPTSDVDARGNYSERVVLTAVTTENANIKVNVNTGFTYQFARGEGSKPSFTAESLEVEMSNIQDRDRLYTGYSETSVLTIKKINKDGNIRINVTPRDYTIVFSSGGQKIENATIERVHYGQVLTLGTEAQQALKAVADTQPNSTLLGFYTGERGIGQMYVDANGAVVPGLSWREQGYYLDTGKYYKSGNYDDHTNTFTLYACWQWDQEEIYIDFEPSLLKGEDFEISVASMFPSVSIDNLFIDPTNTYDVSSQIHISINAGQNMTIVAPDFGTQKYTFHGFVIEREPIAGGEKQEYSTQDGERTYSTLGEAIGAVTHIKLIYYPNINLGISEGAKGQVYASQDNNPNMGSVNSYDSTKSVTLVAVAEIGYELLGWRITGKEYGDQEYEYQAGQPSYQQDGSKQYSITLDNQDKPIELTAIFQGEEVQLKFDIQQVLERLGISNERGEIVGEIISLIINGSQEVRDFSSPFTARVGDRIVLSVRMDYGYGIVFQNKVGEGSNYPAFNPIPNGSSTDSQYRTTYTLEYIVDNKDLKVAGEGHYDTIVFYPTATNNPINYTFQIALRTGSTAELNENVTVVNYTTGDKIVSGETEISVTYGTLVQLAFSTQVRYGIYSVSLVSRGQTRDITNEDGLLIRDEKGNIIGTTINLLPAILQKYNASEDVEIIITFQRLLWTEIEDRELAGSGTEQDPYLIASAYDLAYVAKMVNSGNVHYKDAYYEVTDDLDFSDRYWVPFGDSEEHAFNGYIHFKSYGVSNVVYQPGETYSSTRHNGLFWYVTPTARILQSNAELVIALSVVGSAIGILLIVLLIVLIVRRRRKKRMEELANS